MIVHLKNRKARCNKSEAVNSVNFVTPTNVVPLKIRESFFIAKSVCNSLIVGNPKNEDTDVGPLANVKQYKKKILYTLALMMVLKE